MIPLLFQEGGVYAAKVMMDRDLGARKGGFPGITIGDDFTVMDAVNTFDFFINGDVKTHFSLLPTEQIKRNRYYL